MQQDNDPKNTSILNRSKLESWFLWESFFPTHFYLKTPNPVELKQELAQLPSSTVMETII